MRLDEAMRQAGLCYGERPVCKVLRPMFLDQASWDDLRDRADRLTHAIHAAFEKLRRDPALVAAAGFSAADSRFYDLNGGWQGHDLLGRLDGFLGDDDRCRFIEYNAESPGGMAFGEALGIIFDDLPPMAELRQRFSLRRPPVVTPAVDAMVQAWRTWAIRHERPLADRPRVLIVDLPGIPTAGEFSLFKTAFELAGCPCRIAEDDQLRIVDGELMAGDFRADLVYRRLLTPDIFEHRGGRHLLEEVVRDKLAFVANGFEGHGLCSKALLAVLSDPASRPEGLDEETLRVIEESIPRTRFLNPASIEEAVAQRESLVAKRCSGYGGQAVVLGWRTEPAAWREVLEEGAGGGWILQRRAEMSTRPWPALGADGRAVEYHRMHFDIDPYRIGGEIQGAGVRLSPDEVLNVASGHGSAVPLYLVDPQ